VNASDHDDDRGHSMSTTLYQEGRPTISVSGEVGSRCPEELLARYGEIIEGGRLTWTEYHQLTKRLGAGGQGIVFLTTRRGSDGFTLPVVFMTGHPEVAASVRAMKAGAVDFLEKPVEKDGLVFVLQHVVQL
jgi:ActR/RegA family two-component response regulator